MSDAKHPRPHLVAVADSATEPTAGSPDEDRAQANEPSGRSWLLWLLLVLLIAASAGLVVQTQHAGELQVTVESLEGELFTTRSALDAYEVRFGEVRESVGSLQAQLEQLNALVNADPLSEPAAAGSGESGIPADSTN